MRLSSLAFLAGLTAFAQGQAIKDEKADPTNQGTVYNGVEVPPLLELTPQNWATESKKSRWLMIKHYSPYCPHCIDFAPTFQALYEYYYTSKLEGEDASFTEAYDYRFATINCVAYYDLCIDHEVKSYPTTILFENGEAFAVGSGVKNMTFLSNMTETALEKTKPGSRPPVLDLPEVEDPTETKKKKASKAEEELAGSEKKLSDKTPNESAKKPTDKSTNKLSEKAPAKVDDDVLKKDQVDASEQSIRSNEAANADDKLEKSEKTGKAATSKTGKSDEPLESKVPTSMGEYVSGADWKVPTASELLEQAKPKKPVNPANQNGVSVVLTAESFQRLVTMTQDPWFIKFYAPWCPHCQAMGPTWEQLAKNMQGKLNIGEVNCDKETRLCKDIHARAFPTLLFFRGGDRAEYQGLRGLGDFVQYVEKAIDLADGVPNVDATEFKILEEKEEVIFVYFYDHATTSEDFMALERIPLNLIGHAKIVKTNDPKLYDRFKITTWPRLIASREGRPTYYTPLTPNEMRDVDGVLAWMKSVWLPLVPEMTASNARQIMDRKIVVLGIVNRNEPESFNAALREIKSAANEWMDRQIQEFQLERKKLRDSKQMRIEEAEDRDDQRALRSAKAIRINMDSSGRKEVAFAWIDGVFWHRWLKNTYGIDIKSGERVIINDEDRRRYWDNTVTGNYILVSRTSIMETLDKIVNGPHVIKPKLTISAFEKVFFDIRIAFTEHPFLSFGCVAGIAFGVISWLRGRTRKARGQFRLDDSLLKDGLLGQNGNSKAD